MKYKDLLSIIALGEDSARQFKSDVHNVDALAAEMAALANTEGGIIFIGVKEDGTAPGLSLEDVARINQLISNAASQHVRSPLTVKTENISIPEAGSLVIMLHVSKGIDKPYFDKNGVIWLKSGADKRRINSKEELRRIFQMSDQFHADELPTKAGIDKLDKLRFRDFLRDKYKQEYPDAPSELSRLLQNMNLASETGMLNLAGVLLFSERPEWITPQFVVKAIHYPGDAIHVSQYVDTEDFAGPMRKVFDDALAFIMRNLHKVQAGQGVNAPGQPEIPESVFEELLVNALVHRDYFVSAPIRLFIFDNRIEIISPGHLPNNMTVEKMRTGNSNIRNPILVSFVAKGMLPYHGLGSGIQRALADWTDIDFIDDRDGCIFKATVHRMTADRAFDRAQFVYEIAGSSVKSSVKTAQSTIKERNSSVKTDILPKSSVKSSGKNDVNQESSGKIELENNRSGKTSVRLLNLIARNPHLTIPELSALLGITSRAVEKQLAKLRMERRLQRVGPPKSGHWQVIGTGE